MDVTQMDALNRIAGLVREMDRAFLRGDMNLFHVYRSAIAAIRAGAGLPSRVF